MLNFNLKLEGLTVSRNSIAGKTLYVARGGIIIVYAASTQNDLIYGSLRLWFRYRGRWVNTQTLNTTSPVGTQTEQFAVYQRTNQIAIFLAVHVWFDLRD